MRISTVTKHNVILNNLRCLFRVNRFISLIKVVLFTVYNYSKSLLTTINYSFSITKLLYKLNEL